MANGNTNGGGVTLDPNDMESAMEIMGLSPDLMNKAFEVAGQTYSSRFGEPTEFSEEDRRIMETLRGRVEQLQTTDIPAPIDGLLPGNPYAVNFRGLSQGLQNLVGEYAKRGKAEELYGDPERAERITDRAQNRLKKAQELRATATGLQSAGEQLPGTQVIIDQMLSDAQKLEEEAARDQRAAEQSRGVLSRFRELEEREALSQAEKAQRDEFIRNFGEETYTQALEAEREDREQRALTDRERVRQQALTERNEADIEYGITKARIEADARVRTSERAEATAYPYYAQPEYVQEFISNYIDPIENQIDTLEGQLFYDDGTPDATAPAELQQQYQTLQQQQRILRDINLDAITYEQLQEDGYTEDQLPETHAPTPEQRQLINWMITSGMAPEMVDAYKFYNRISLNKAPQPAPSTPQEQPGDLGAAFSEQEEPGSMLLDPDKTTENETETDQDTE